MCTQLKIALCLIVFSILFVLNESTDKKQPSAVSDRLVYHPRDEDYDDELERKPAKLKTPEVSSNASLRNAIVQ
ncbi:hypothetical protein QE152_g9940 [Popillia japonica]|uniref:Uncharacterized protein n=1 Tax=Popillia japonica TaxID=7064 RepID=A0AAW1LWK7_POPJA